MAVHEEDEAEVAASSTTSGELARSSWSSREAYIPPGNMKEHLPQYQEQEGLVPPLPREQHGMYLSSNDIVSPSREASPLYHHDHQETSHLPTTVQQQQQQQQPESPSSEYTRSATSNDLLLGYHRQELQLLSLYNRKYKRSASAPPREFITLTTRDALLLYQGGGDEEDEAPCH